MGLLSKLKSLLGFGDDRPARRGNVDVTVEHEPGESADAESERAVKEPATEPEPTVEETAESDSDPEVEPEPEPTEDETGTGTAETAGTTDDAESAGEPAVDEPTVEEEVVEEAEPAQTGAAAESVDTIKGIGPSYAEKLSSAGVETVGDLASADADALGDETGLSPKRIAGWIEQAEARTQ